MRREFRLSELVLSLPRILRALHAAAYREFAPENFAKISLSFSIDITSGQIRLCSEPAPSLISSSRRMHASVTSGNPDFVLTGFCPYSTLAQCAAALRPSHVFLLVGSQLSHRASPGVGLDFPR